ncbi:MAG: hypothetical protein ABI946_08535 [Chthoniobacterales bacterium]
MFTRSNARPSLRSALLASLAICLAVSAARGVILLGTADPTANTTAPTGDLANSGWQYEGAFVGFLGTVIGPNHFITAAHIGGGAGATIVFNGVTYIVTEGRYDPYTDLVIWRVDGTFPMCSPIYTGDGETGQRLVVFGRGTQRGAEVIKNSTLRGWLWGPGDGVQRWGENFVTSIVRGGPVNQYVYATFDASGSANEAHLSSGDSGGALFIEDGAIWKLAGINYAVDGPIYTTDTGGTAFNGALFDARDFYYQNETNPMQYDLITGPGAVPTGFYCSRISSRSAWIYSVLDPSGDANANGVSNLVDYAQSLNMAEPVGPGVPTVMRASGMVSVIYRKLVIANAPQYVVQSSTDLRNWTTVTPTETLVAVNGDVQTVKATVPASGDRLFLRVLINPPAP